MCAECQDTEDQHAACCYVYIEIPVVSRMAAGAQPYLCRGLDVHTL